MCLIDPFEHSPVMMELKHDLCSTPAEMLQAYGARGASGIVSTLPLRRHSDLS